MAPRSAGRYAPIRGRAVRTEADWILAVCPVRCGVVLGPYGGAGQRPGAGGRGGPADRGWSGRRGGTGRSVAAVSFAARQRTWVTGVGDVAVRGRNGVGRRQVGRAWRQGPAIEFMTGEGRRPWAPGICALGCGRRGCSGFEDLVGLAPAANCWPGVSGRFEREGHSPAPLQAGRAGPEVSFAPRPSRGGIAGWLGSRRGRRR
jgi:hypothetical protein